MPQIQGKQKHHPLNIKLSCAKMLHNLGDADMGRVVNLLTIMRSLQPTKQLWKQRSKREKQIRTASLSLLLKFVFMDQNVPLGMSTATSTKYTDIFM